MPIDWIPGRDDTTHVGIIGYGLYIVLDKYPDGWRVSFGANSLPRRFVSETVAKQEGVALARRILTECLINLSEVGHSAQA